MALTYLGNVMDHAVNVDKQHAPHSDKQRKKKESRKRHVVLGTEMEIRRGLARPPASKVARFFSSASFSLSFFFGPPLFLKKKSCCALPNRHRGGFTGTIYTIRRLQRTSSSILPAKALNKVAARCGEQLHVLKRTKRNGPAQASS